MQHAQKGAGKILERESAIIVSKSGRYDFPIGFKEYIVLLKTWSTDFSEFMKIVVRLTFFIFIEGFK